MSRSNCLKECTILWPCDDGRAMHSLECIKHFSIPIIGTDGCVEAEVKQHVSCQVHCAFMTHPVAGLVRTQLIQVKTRTVVSSDGNRNSRSSVPSFDVKVA